MKNMKLGNTIKSLRQDKGFKQAELAQRSGISRPYLSEIENNKKLPDIETLESISKALGLPVVAIFLKSFNIEDVPTQSREEVINSIKDSMKRLEIMVA